MRCLNCGKNGLSVSTEVCPSCGVHIPTLMRDVLPPGTELRGGAYRIDYALGRGGFGITYRAGNIYFKEVVAIKEYYPHEHAFREGATGKLNVPATQADSYQRGLQRFIREGQILRGINHPNIVGVKDIFEECGTAYLVMEMVDGKTLADELKTQPNGRLSPKRVEEIIGQLVAALDKVHQGEVHHLDLKPNNVLLAPDGRVVLVDFGAARRGFSSTTTQAFTLEYAPLELISGADVGPESDLFEVGMMLHEMLTGELPPSALERLRNTWEPNSISDPWKSLLQKALAMDMEQRPSSIQTWWDAKAALPPPPPGRENEELVGMIETAMGISSKAKPTETTKAPGREPASKSLLDQLNDLF